MVSCAYSKKNACIKQALSHWGRFHTGKKPIEQWYMYTALIIALQVKFWFFWFMPCADHQIRLCIFTCSSFLIASILFIPCWIKISLSCAHFVDWDTIGIANNSITPHYFVPEQESIMYYIRSVVGSEIFKLYGVICRINWVAPLIGHKL